MAITNDLTKTTTAMNTLFIKVLINLLWRYGCDERIMYHVPNGG